MGFVTPDKEKFNRTNWFLHAPKDELASLEAFGTWELLPVPHSARLLPLCWVFTEKFNASGERERCKARLVAKGFMQRPGIDFDETFAPVTKYSTIRALPAVSAHKDWDLAHLDIKTAFLNGELHEEIWVQDPPGFPKSGPGEALRLRRSLYRLKQAPRQWHHKLSSMLAELDFLPSPADPGLYVLRDKDGDVMAALTTVVDDMLLGRGAVTGGRAARHFTIPYASLVGSMLYLSVTTRPDIAQAAGALASFMAAPCVAHWGLLLGVLRYLKATAKTGLTYRGGTLELFADYAGCPDTRRSTTGYAFVFNGAAISWQSRRQPTIATSTAEAEYMAAASATKEALWLGYMLTDIGIQTKCVPIMSDSQASLALIRNPVVSQRAKHIDMAYHFVRERVASDAV